MRINEKAIGECAYCGSDIFEGDEFYACGGILLCCAEHRDAYIAEHTDEYDIDDFIYWAEGEFDLDTERENWKADFSKN